MDINGGELIQTTVSEALLKCTIYSYTCTNNHLCISPMVVIKALETQKLVIKNMTELNEGLYKIMFKTQKWLVCAWYEKEKFPHTLYVCAFQPFHVVCAFHKCDKTANNVTLFVSEENLCVILSDQVLDTFHANFFAH